MEKNFDLVLSRHPVSPCELFAVLSSQCELLNIHNQDVYGDFNSENSWLRKFENEVANDLGMESGLFIPSGVMAQSMVLKIAEEMHGLSNKFICHYSSHLLLHEKDSFSQLLKLSPVIISAKSDVIEQQPMLYSEVKDILDEVTSSATDNNVHSTACALVVECPHREIGGKCTPWADLVEMSKHCRRNKVHIHMDGARLWEASASDEYSEHSIRGICELFDSVYVSFYKGIGGITGAMLLGKTDFILNARIWLRRFGGNLYSQMPYAISCWSKYRENKDSFLARKKRMVEVIAALTNAFITEGVEKGDKCFVDLIRFDPPIPQVSMIHVYLNANTDVCIEARNRTLLHTGISCFTFVRPAAAESCVFEFNMGPLNQTIGIEVWLRGWTHFLTELHSLK